MAFASLSEIKSWLEYGEEDQQTSAKNVYSANLRIWFHYTVDFKSLLKMQ